MGCFAASSKLELFTRPSQHNILFSSMNRPNCFSIREVVPLARIMSISSWKVYI